MLGRPAPNGRPAFRVTAREARGLGISPPVTYIEVGFYLALAARLVGLLEMDGWIWGHFSRSWCNRDIWLGGGVEREGGGIKRGDHEDMVCMVRFHLRW